MKLSDRDKKLLLILAIVAIICIPYFLISGPISEKNTAVKAEVDTLQSQYDYLKGLYDQKDFFVSETMNYETQRVELISRFPEDIDQEAVIYFIHNTEELLPVTMAQVGLGEITAGSILGAATTATSNVATDTVAATDATTTTDAAATADGTVTTTDPTVTTAIGSDLVGVTTTTSLSYTCTYDSFKKFINYIKEYEDRMVAPSFSASYTVADDMVSGSVTLIQYAIKGEGRELPAYGYKSDYYGTDNIFVNNTSANYDPTTAGYNYDFFVMLSQPAADVQSFIVGKANDGDRESYIYTDDNGKQQITITVSGSEGAYLIGYQIGDISYAESAFDPGDMLDLKIISSARVGSEDLVSSDVNLINETDKTLYVSIVNDDKENKRVNIASVTGDISVY